MPWCQWDIPEKKVEGTWGCTFQETPGVSRFVTLPLEIPEKTKVYT